MVTSTNHAMADPSVTEEVFGPSSVGVLADDKEAVLAFAKSLQGHLTATIHGTDEDIEEYKELIDILTLKVGRLIFNGFPTGVEVSPAMVHGGPFPSTTDVRSTSVGTTAIYRFTRPICFQDLPDRLKNEKF
jgi:NADP-dependent aldehyde dehydrogenase